MIKLKPWKIGISRRYRQTVYFGLSYHFGWLSPNLLLYHRQGIIYSTYRGVVVQPTQFIELTVGQSVSFSFEIETNNPLGIVKLTDS